MAQDLQHILEAVGFSDREAKLYLQGLNIGHAPASTYADKSGYNRITTYNTLEDLVRRGYFTKVKKVRSQWYAPVSPEYVSVEAQKNAQALERSLPELKSLMGGKYRKPRVRFFEGLEGIKRVYADTLTAESELLNIANGEVLRRHWPSYDEEYVAERVRRGIHLRGIAPDDPVDTRVHGEDAENLREIRLIPAEEFDFTNEVTIYDHKVAIASYGEDEQDMFGVIIESPEAAKTQKQIFEMAWRYAATVPRKLQPSQPILIA